MPGCARPRAGLVVKNLVVEFGGLVAVDGANLEAPVGRITGLIGPNGAGKTTTFNACSGLVTSKGTIWLDGRDITGLSPAKRARLGLGRTFQKLDLFSRLTVAENVELAHEASVVSDRVLGQLFARRKERAVSLRKASQAMELCAIADLADRKAGSLSTGQKRLVELAMTVVGSYSILLLDEPSSGLDSRETDMFGRILQDVVSQTGAGILLVEHDMSLVASVCEYLYVLDFGRPLLDGPTADVLASEAVALAYLGSEALDASSQGVGQHA